MSRRTLVIFAGLAVVFAVLTAVAVNVGLLRGADAPAAIGGQFQLVDQAGRPADERILKGRWSAVFFGFTYCPDICPTTLFALGQAEARLGSRAKDFQAVLISVDPARDTPARMAAYAATPGFPKQLRALTGSPEQVAGAARAYRVFHQKQGEGPDYLVNHSSVVYLMNPRGRFACVIQPGASPDEMAARIAAAMAKGAGAEAC